ncbi:hypothetical protein ACFRAU_25035 [Arthrobacter sp. NPDC056691]|uniref:hypothetical protein n=1 Tax=Arthrobacter sp. NPDC056691 TaxID=3345913 RepID=UPI003673606F
MTTIVRARLHYAIFLVLGAEKPTIPNVTEDGLVWASEDALVIGGRSGVDGETTIHIGPLAPSQELIGLGPRTIQCPAGQIRLETADGERLSQHQVNAEQARVGIWVDDLAEPGIVHLQIT